MLEKAIVVAKAALEFILKSFPADDEKFVVIHTSSKSLFDKFDEIMAELKKVEHEQKSTAYPKKCPCRLCDPEAKVDGELMEKCIKEAVEESISGVETVYDAEAGVDNTGEATESIPMTLLNLTEAQANVAEVVLPTVVETQ